MWIWTARRKSGGLALLLLLIFPAWGESRESPEAIRAVQVFDLPGGSEGAARLLDAVERVGANSIFLRLFEDGGPGIPPEKTGVYFPTTHAPVIQDWLSPLLTLAEGRGIRVYGWMTTMVQPWVLVEHPTWAVQVYEYSTRRYIPLTGSTPVWKGEYGWSHGSKVSLFVPEHRARLKALFQDLARFPLAGILLQDDLAFSPHEDYSPAAREEFSRMFGRALDPQKMFTPSGAPTAELWEWQRWKAERLLDFATEIRTAIRAVRPGMTLALDVYPESGESRRRGLLEVSQDLTAARRYPLDLFVLMLHHRDIARERRLTAPQTHTLIQRITRRAVALLGPERVLVKITVADWLPPEGTGRVFPLPEIEAAVRAASRGGARHLAVTPFPPAESWEIPPSLWRHPQR